MTIYLDNPLADDIAHADAVEQQQAARISIQHAGLDTGYIANLIQRDANPFDLIDQATIMPLPDDRDVDTDLF